VGHRLDRHHPMGLGLLSLIKPSDERFKANRKIGRFNKWGRGVGVNGGVGVKSGVS
jgi:hypothetical protein